MNHSQMAATGETHAAAFLRQRGFRVRQVSGHPDSANLEASSTTQKLFIQVKTALDPALPPDPTPAEIRDLILRAARTGREAWQAKVTINESGDLTRHIRWIHLA